MALNPSIILAGRQPDVINALAGGAQAANAVNTVRRQNSLSDLYQEQGPGIMAGDQNALNALAQLSPQEALGIQNSRQIMDVRGQENARADERLQMARQQAAQQAQAQIAQMTAAERAAEREALERGLAGAAAINDPQTWDSYMQSLGLEQMVGQFENREIAFASALGLKDALERAQGPGPQSGAGKFYADQQAGLVPADAEYSGGGVTINTGDNAPQIGTIPQGYQVIRDPESGAYQMQPIPGGPEDTTRQDAARRESQETSGDVVLNAALRARDAAGDRWVGGLAGQAAAMNPSTSNAELYRQVNVLRSNATIESLNAMRQQSATGGALGNVTEGEGAMLAARAGALDPGSPNFERDLADYTRTLLRTIHGAEAGERIFKEQWDETQNGVRRVEPIPNNGPGPAPEQPNANAPQAGVTEDGYRFLGGDPGDPSNWEKVQ